MAPIAEQGRPTTPKPRRAGYKEERAPEFFERFHRYARKHKPLWPLYLVLWVITAVLVHTWLRLRVRGRNNIPRQGSVIIAPNHFSFLDHFVVALWVPRRVRFMAKSQMFQSRAHKRPLNWILTRGGAFPVCRGVNGAEPALRTAFELLETDQAVTMYPEGGRSRTGDIADRAKPGVGRLALETGAVVVPTAICGTERLRRLKKVTVRYGKPLYFEWIAHPSKEQQQQAADEILRAVRLLYYGELAQAQLRREKRRQHCTK